MREPLVSLERFMESSLCSQKQSDAQVEQWQRSQGTDQKLQDMMTNSKSLMFLVGGADASHANYHWWVNPKSYQPGCTLPSLAHVKLQRTAVEKRTNKKKRQKCVQTFFEKHNRDNLIQKEESQWCLIQENRQNGVVMIFWGWIKVHCTEFRQWISSHEAWNKPWSSASFLELIKNRLCF